MKWTITYRPFRFTLLSILVLWTFGLQAQLKIQLELAVPKLVEENGIYLSTDFNDWNPGDSDFQLKKLNDSLYEINLSNVPEVFEYKFTQGTWATTEGTPAGLALPNRVYNKASNPSQFIKCNLLGWEQSIQYNILVKSIPEQTPKGSVIYITGNFNSWNPGEEAYRLKKNLDGTYRTKVYTDLDHIEFKFTRGDWSSVESRLSGKARPNRFLDRSSTKEPTNLEFSIEGWEDLHGVFSFFSIYDILLLFSVFQGILLLIAIPSLQSSNKSANKWLLMTIGLSSFCIFFYLLSNFESAVQSFPKILFVSDLCLFLYAPLFFFYLRGLLFSQRQSSSRWYIHFIPFLIQVLVYLPFFLQSDKAMLDRIMGQEELLVNVFLITGLLAFFWNAYYWNLFRKTILAYEEQFKTNYSFEQNHNYLNTVLIIQFICLVLWFVFFVILLITRLFNIDLVGVQESFVDLIWLVFSVITFILGYFAIKQPETFKADLAPVSIFDDILESTVSESKKVTETTAEYENQPIIDVLEKHLAEAKPFINPKLTLSDLAAQINLQPHLLSKAINEHYHKNFFELINTYRIEEFKELVKIPKYQNYTLLALAFEVGFNSKTAFNRSFKKITELTPKAYFESIMEDAKLD